METTRELYQRAKAAAGCDTDYAFAKKTGISRAVVSRWTNGQVSFDDEHAEMIAGILGVEPGYVLACANAERAKSARSKSTWARVAAVLLATSLPPAAGATSAHDLTITATEYTLSALRRRMALALGLIPGPDFA